MTPEVFSSLNVARFTARLSARECASLPAFLGSTLRGALGHALKQAVCVADHGDCSQCAIAGQCIYPYLFETPVPADIMQLRGQRHAPLPFIIEPPIVLNPVKRVWKLPAASDDAVLAEHAAHSTLHPITPRDRAIGRKSSVVTSVVLPDQAKRFDAGEDLSFGFTLVGRAIAFLPYVVCAIAELGRRGLGANRASFELKEVWLKKVAETSELIYTNADQRLTFPHVGRPLSELVSERLLELRREKVTNSEDTRASRSANAQAPFSAPRTLESAIAECLSEFRSAKPDGSGRHECDVSLNNWDARRVDPQAEPGHRLKLRFLTPTRIRVQGDLQTGLSFELLVRSLLRRISTLAAVHGPNRLELDYRGLIERAASVKTRRSLLRWWDLERYSNRQSGKLKVGGLIGEVEYDGDAVEDYLPLLVAGELLQVGTGASYGLGRYEILKI